MDWKDNIRSILNKRAAELPDDKEVEMVFMEQAYNHIQNKARPLMKSPYQLGFEIVEKNDTNTKMIGVFAFRVGATLIYSPVFFLNGDIKGSDLMYNHKEKWIHPQTPDWCEFELAKIENQEGKAISRDQAKKVPMQMNLQKIVRPEFHRKSASLWLNPDVDIEDKELPSANWAEVKDHMKIEKSAVERESLQFGELLGDYLEQSAPEGIDALANLMEKASHQFNNYLYQRLPEGFFECDSFYKSKQEKKASTDEGTVKLHLGRFNPHNKQASMEEQMEDAYSWEDNRPKTTVEEAYVVNENEEDLMETPTEMGKYKVLLKGGYFIDCVVVPCAQQYDKYDDHYPVAYDSEYGLSDKHPGFTIVNLDNKESKRVETKLYTTGKDENYDFGCCSDRPVQGSFNIVVYNGKALKNTFCRKKSTKDGITTCYCDNGYASEYNKCTIVINPELEKSDPERFVFKPEDVQFIKVKTTSEEYDSSHKRPAYITCDVGNETDMSTYLLKTANAENMSVIKVQQLARGFTVKSGSDQYDNLNSIGLEAYFIANCGTSVENAKDLAKAASQNIVTRVMAKKAATQIRLDEREEFTQNYNSDFGIREEHPETFILVNNGDTQGHPDHRVGDKYDNEGMSSDYMSLLNMTPEELMQKAEESGSDSVLEHGLIGSLSRTYNALPMVEKYIRDMKTGLDAKGRLLFLFYWRPEDFIEAYGTDDQAEIENMLISSFQSDGDLVLELLKKSPEMSEYQTVDTSK